MYLRNYNGQYKGGVFHWDKKFFFCKDSYWKCSLKLFCHMKANWNNNLKIQGTIFFLFFLSLSQGHFIYYSSNIDGCGNVNLLRLVAQKFGKQNQSENCESEFCECVVWFVTLQLVLFLS